MKDDIIQFVTNALYRAHDNDMQSMNPVEFDKWIEAQMEAMDKYIKELQPISPDKDVMWISVKERMPEEEVLLLTTSKVITMGDWYKEAWRTSQSYWKEGVLLSVYQKDDITHWMPLPKITNTESNTVSLPDKDKIIAKQDGLIKMLVDGYGERFKDNALWKKLESELAELKKK
jgi:hypothetical protein